MFEHKLRDGNEDEMQLSAKLRPSDCYLMEGFTDADIFRVGHFSVKGVLSFCTCCSASFVRSSVFGLRNSFFRITAVYFSVSGRSTERAGDSAPGTIFS